MNSPTETTPTPSSSAIVELRRYKLRPGQRDTLIDLFEREFVESQEAVGIELIGLFRDLDDPDAFVWLRGFPDAEARQRSLEAFYHGPTWKEHREAANATMIDINDVRMLRPASTLSAPESARVTTRQPGMSPVPGRLVVATIESLAASPDGGRLDLAGATMLGRFVTDHRPNNFPRLPVREGENLSVCFWVFPDAAASREQIIASLTPESRREECAGAGSDPVGRGFAIWRLRPTERSRWS